MAKKKPSYASQAKKIMAKYKVRLGDDLSELDPMAEKSLIAELTALKQKQEIQRVAMEADNTRVAPQFVTENFNLGGYINPDIPPVGQEQTFGNFNILDNYQNPYIDPINMGTQGVTAFPNTGVPEAIATRSGANIPTTYNKDSAATYSAPPTDPPFIGQSGFMQPGLGLDLTQPSNPLVRWPGVIEPQVAPVHYTGNDNTDVPYEQLDIGIQPQAPATYSAHPTSIQTKDTYTHDPTLTGDPGDNLKGGIVNTLGNTEALTMAAQALPAVANLARGVFGKTEKLNKEDYQITPERIEAPEYDVSEELRGIEGQTNITRRNLRNSMAGQIAAQTAGGQALSKAQQYKANVDAQNQMQADTFNARQSLMAQGQNAQSDYGVDQFNLQSEATKSNLASMGLSQLSDLGQYVGQQALYKAALADNKELMKGYIDATNKNIMGDYESPVKKVDNPILRPDINTANLNPQSPATTNSTTPQGTGTVDPAKAAHDADIASMAAAQGANSPIAEDIPGYGESLGDIWNQDKSFTEKISETVSLTGQAALDVLSDGSRFISGDKPAEKLKDEPLTKQERMDLLKLGALTGVNFLSLYKQSEAPPPTHKQDPNFNPIYNTSEIYNPAAKQAEKEAYVKKLYDINKRISTFDPYNLTQ